MVRPFIPRHLPTVPIIPVNDTPTVGWNGAEAPVKSYRKGRFPVELFVLKESRFTAFGKDRRGATFFDDQGQPIEQVSSRPMSVRPEAKKKEAQNAPSIRDTKFLPLGARPGRANEPSFTLLKKSTHGHVDRQVFCCRKSLS